MSSAYYNPVAPTPPNFHICDTAYGTGLVVADCMAALNFLPGGSASIPFTLTQPQHPVGLPLYVESEGCAISVEVAGPNTPASINLVPNTLRQMASWVIKTCVIDSDGLAGFVTAGIGNMIDYVIERGIPPELLDVALPASTTFITLTVTSSASPKSGMYSPGNNDPEIPILIGKYVAGATGVTETPSSMRKVNSVGAKMWEISGAGMIRGGSTTWWLSAVQALKSAEMIYECDANLGSPPEVDCTHIEWSQLGPASVNPPSDTISVGPGVVKFLHSNTCYLAISAVQQVVLNWDQIRAAVAALMNVCIQNPIQPSIGGRAYYAPTNRVLSKSRRRKRDNQVTGLNALPPPATITMFQQQSPWTNPTVELASCTWDAVVHRVAISKCKNG